ncbi:bifunctional 4-hydroxy-2-oxoglutarate aldolase/2-dehydro-3-deoxy-phosphogluconate aldolase [Propionibacteriaceae bacterium Y1923]
MTVDRLPLPECITGPRMIVLLDRRNDDDGDDDARFAQLVPVLEVMVQEGLTTFALEPADLVLLGQLREIFTERAHFGAYDVLSADGAHSALAHGPEFILANGDDAEVVRVGTEAGVATLSAALTPNEVRHGWDLGSSAVQVLPADLLGSSYPEALKKLVPGISFIPRGNLGGWSMGRWFEAGAIACVADSPLLGDALNHGNLSHLRDRCRTYLDVVPKPKAETDKS